MSDKFEVGFFGQIIGGLMLIGGLATMTVLVSSFGSKEKVKTVEKYREDQLDALHRAYNIAMSDRNPMEMDRIMLQIDTCINAKEQRVQNGQLLNVKCAVCEKEMKSKEKVAVCQECIIPAVLEFHAKARFELEKNQ